MPATKRNSTRIAFAKEVFEHPSKPCYERTYRGSNDLPTLKVWQSSKDKQWYWHLKSPGNNKTISDGSEGYKTKRAFIGALQRFRGWSYGSGLADLFTEAIEDVLSPTAG